MNNEQIKQLIEGREPIAIVRYFERPVFVHDYTNVKYIILKINRNKDGINEIKIPDGLVSFLRSKLKNFEEVIRKTDGTVWERFSFRVKAKSLVSKQELTYFINQQ